MAGVAAPPRTPWPARSGRRSRAVRARARAHLLALAALLLLVLAWRFRLEQLRARAAARRRSCPGATYTDVARPRCRRCGSLRSLALAGAAAVPVRARAAGAAGRRRRPCALVAVLALGVRSDLPGAVAALRRRSRRRSPASGRTSPTRSRSPAARTGSTASTSRDAAGGAELSRARRRARRGTVDNVPLWDQDVLRPAIDELQSIGRYYGFPSVTRRPLHGRRQADGHDRRRAPARPAAAGRRATAAGRPTGSPTRTATASSAVHGGDADAGGYPRFAQQGFGAARTRSACASRGSTSASSRGADPPYVVAQQRAAPRSTQPAPASRARLPLRRRGGIGLSGLAAARRVRDRFGDLDLLLSETRHRRARGSSSTATRATALRDARARSCAGTAAADRGRRRPRQVPLRRLHDQRLAIPTRRRSAFGRRGQLRARRRRARSSTRSAAREHLRRRRRRPDPARLAGRLPGPVPAGGADAGRRCARTCATRARLFAAQVRRTRTTTPTTRPRSGTAPTPGQRALQLAGPVEKAGEIRFPDPLDGRRDERRVAPRWRMRRRRGCPATGERFMLTMPFTPRGRENLVGYLAGSLDAPAGPRLTLLSLPRDRLTVGPTQATRRILAEPGREQRLQLLNRESRDLGQRAVSRTVLGSRGSCRSATRSSRSSRSTSRRAAAACRGSSS